MEVDWESRARLLWDLLDDIAKLDDACKGNDLAFRNRVRRRQRRRFEIISSAAYVITFKETDT